MTEAKNQYTDTTSLYIILNAATSQRASWQLTRKKSSVRTCIEYVKEINGYHIGTLKYLTMWKRVECDFNVRFASGKR